jgi:hypothetical protein
LRHRVLHPGEGRIALGAGQAGRNREIIDDMQDRHDQDKGEVIPVRDVDMRLVPACECADVEDEVDHPDDDQQDVGIPFRFGVFLGLRDAHQVARGGEQAEQVEAQQDEPGRDLPRKTGPAGALHHMIGCRDQRIAAKSEDHPRGVHGPDAPEARPCRIKAQVRPGKLCRDPDAHAHGNDRPEQRNHQAHLGRIVVVAEGAILLRCRVVDCAQDRIGGRAAEQQYDPAMHAHRVRVTRHSHDQPEEHNGAGDDKRALTFAACECRNHCPLSCKFCVGLRLGVIG